MKTLGKKAMVVFSGGQDSTTCLQWAMKNFEAVETVGFNYGQKHTVELTCAKDIADIYRIPYKVINIDFLSDISVSALVQSSDNNVNEKHPLNDNLPASFVPFRNLLFLTIASAYALKKGCNDLVTGVNAIDYSGYPDCRPQFIDKLMEVLGLATDSEAMSIKIHTPLMKLSKADIFALSDELGGLSVVIENSHTCYNGDHKTYFDWGYGCGECPSCKLRAKGYQEFMHKKLNAEKEA